MIKKLERCYKIAFSGADGGELSSINVNAYKNRFMDFMKEKVFNYDFNHRIDVCTLSKGLKKGDFKVNDLEPF